MCASIGWNPHFSDIKVSHVLGALLGARNRCGRLGAGTQGVPYGIGTWPDVAASCLTLRWRGGPEGWPPRPCS